MTATHTKLTRKSTQAPGIKPATETPEAAPNTYDGYSIRELRNIAVKKGIGDARWRALATQEDLMEAIAAQELHETEPETPVVETPVVETATAVETPALLPGLFIPEEDSTFVLSDILRSYLSALRRMSEAPKPKIMNTLLVGPQGCGKTSVAYEFAARMKMPLLKMNCPLVREPRDWFGSKQASAGSVFWDKALFAQAIAQGNVVVVLDEITRATPSVLNSLLPLLDWTRASFVEEAKETLKVGPNTFFFATANIGSQFTGTFRLDAALADRFGAIVECEFLPADEEAVLLVQRTGIAQDIAQRLVKIANMVRNENRTSGKLTETISTRVLLDVATLYLSVKESAFRFTLLPKFSADGGAQSERAQVLGFIQGQFPKLTI